MGQMEVIVAVEMSTHPFKSFSFDGIFGLGLGTLAMSERFSAFGQLVQTGIAQHPRFSIFLADNEAESSEIAFGGYNSERLIEPLSWAPVSHVHLGHWQVDILDVRVGGVSLGICDDGECRGVVDTGTSHLGVPHMAHKEFAQMLSVDAGELLDCRLAEAPSIEIILVNKTLKIRPDTYMRRLPLRDDVSVRNPNGIMRGKDDVSPFVPEPALESSGLLAESSNVTRSCSGRTMPVKLPEPLGPKLWILGEPVLHRYYTVFDWVKQEIGFGLSSSLRNTGKLIEMDPRGSLPMDVDMLLMQQSATTDLRSQMPDDSTVFVQVTVAVRVRRV